MTVRQWYWVNLQLLRYKYSLSPVTFDDEEFTWIRIDAFPLPPNFHQKATRLLLVLPGVHQPITLPPRSFYLDSHLTTVDGRTPAHVFEQQAYHGARNLSQQGYAYYCMLFNQWWPSADVVSGDNLVSVTNTIRRELRRA